MNRLRKYAYICNYACQYMRKYMYIATREQLQTHKHTNIQKHTNLSRHTHKLRYTYIQNKTRFRTKNNYINRSFIENYNSVWRMRIAWNPGSKTQPRNIDMLVGWLFGCYGISTSVGYLIPNTFFFTNNQFYFKQFSLARVHSSMVKNIFISSYSVYSNSSNSKQLV